MPAVPGCFILRCTCFESSLLVVSASIQMFVEVLLSPFNRVLFYKILILLYNTIEFVLVTTLLLKQNLLSQVMQIYTKIQRKCNLTTTGNEPKRRSSLSSLTGPYCVCEPLNYLLTKINSPTSRLHRGAFKFRAHNRNNVSPVL